MILVEVYVPAMDEKFDFELDENAPIYQIIGELCEMLSKRTKSPVINDIKEFMLCSIDRQEILMGENTLFQSHIGDGSRLLLV